MLDIKKYCISVLQDIFNNNNNNKKYYNKNGRNFICTQDFTILSAKKIIQFKKFTVWKKN